MITFNFLPIAAILLSLAGFYLPGFKKWYSKLSAEYKQLFMLFFVFLGAGGAWILSMFGLIEIYPNLEQSAWYESGWLAVVDFVVAMTANIATYKSSDKIADRFNGRA